MTLPLEPKTQQQLIDLAHEHNISVDEMVQYLIDKHQQSSEMELRYRGLFEQSNDAVFLLDLTGQHVDCNQRASDLFGYSVEELVEISFRELVKYEETSHAMTILNRLLAGETPEPYQRIFLHKNGSEIPVEVNVECIFDKHGKALYLQSIVRDIRSRLQMEERLRTSEEQHRTILNTMVEGVVIHNASGEILLSNPAAENLLGLSSEQMRGLTPIDSTWRTIREDGSNFEGKDHPTSVTLSQGIPQHNILMGVYKPDGALTWISVTSVPMFDSDGNIYRVMVTFSDITDLKKAQEHTVNIAVQQERMNVLAKFIQSTSHEFRTPLSIIQTNTYLLSRKYAEHELLHGYLNKIDNQVDRIARLVNRLLIMAKLDATTDPEFNITIRLNLLMDELANQNTERLQAQSLNLELIGNELDVHVKSHKDYLSQALQAILDNALAHSPPHSTIYFSLSVTSEFATLMITDEGTGIEEENMPYIFERFWRADTAHTKEGFGLGLPIAERIIRLHGGHISVESELGDGTTLTISLPLL